MPIISKTLDDLIRKTEQECNRRGIKKEKIVMINTLEELVDFYGYLPEQIEAFVLVQMGSDEKEADIVIYTDNRRTKPLIVIETKSPDKHEGIKQAISYANALGAQFAMWTNGVEIEVYDLVENKAISSIPHAYQPKGSLIYGNGVGKSLEPIVDVNEFKRIIAKLHDIMRDIEKKALQSAFDVISRLIYAKVYDEKSTPKGKYYAFQVGYAEDIKTVADRIKKLYNLARKKEPHIFPEDIGVSHDLTLFEIAKVVGRISFKETDLDIKGEAYQHFLDANMRGVLGQYFTPREIVKAMVKMVDPDENNKILDPACGTGGFLLYSLFHVRRKIEQNYPDPLQVKEKLIEFAYYQLYGIEIERDVAQAAISSMILSDDAHSHIVVMDALAPWEGLEKHGLRPESFDIILTNPPLGLYEKRKEILDQFETGRGKNKQLSQVLFVERGLEFLKPGGILATIMSEDVLERDKDFMRFLDKNGYIRALVSLPREAFIPYGANSKTNILIIQKPSPELPDVEEVFMAEARFVGYDTSGKRIDKNDLLFIVKKWHEFEQKYQFLEVLKYG